jgi:threonine dehydrogenase-like Zn-dependent dehydrogenase
MFAFMRDGRLNVAPLRSHFIPPARAPEAYRGLQEQRDRYWGVVFDWRDA